LGETIVLPGFIANQRQWHNFKCAENGTQANHRWCRTREVEMVKRADDGARQEDSRRCLASLKIAKEHNQSETAIETFEIENRACESVKLWRLHWPIARSSFITLATPNPHTRMPL
jgi:hypothetical protein